MLQYTRILVLVYYVHTSICISAEAQALRYENSVGAVNPEFYLLLFMTWIEFSIIIINMSL